MGLPEKRVVFRAWDKNNRIMTVTKPTKPRYIRLDPLIPWLREPHPVPWEKYFGREAELEVEIGFGLGDFLVRSACDHPEKDFIGIDQEWISIKRTLRKIAQAGAKNIRLVQADARVALEHLFRPRSVKRAYALFPCPWPKKRHAKWRLFSADFLGVLNNRLASGAEALIVTDHEPYLQWILERVPGTGFRAATASIPPRYSTKYERKWQDLGQERFFELRLYKERHVDLPEKEEVTLKTYRIEHFDPDRFRPAGDRGDIVVEFKEFLFDPSRRVAMLRAFVVEDRLTQDFWIQIAHRPEGWKIRPARGCSLIPTLGTQRALDLAFAAARGRVQS